MYIANKIWKRIRNVVSTISFLVRKLNVLLVRMGALGLVIYVPIKNDETMSQIHDGKMCPVFATGLVELNTIDAWFKR